VGELVEETPRRAVELRHDHALRAVMMNVRCRCERQLARYTSCSITSLSRCALDLFALLRRSRAFERRGVGQIALDALVHGVLGSPISYATNSSENSSRASGIGNTPVNLCSPRCGGDRSRLSQKSRSFQLDLEQVRICRFHAVDLGEGLSFP